MMRFFDNIFHFPNNLLDLLRLPVELSQDVRVDNLRLLHELNARHHIARLQHHQPKSELALCRQYVLRAQLNFKEDQNIFEMLVGFLVVDVVDHGVLHFIEVSLQDVLLPYLNDLLIKTPRIIDLALLLE